MKVVLVGCTGFIGQALVRRLVEDGHECTVLTRSKPASRTSKLPQGVKTTSYSQMPDSAEAVVNLAGETVAGFWTKKKKAKILDSRIKTTRNIVDWMGALSDRPFVFLSASAVGYYGDRGTEVITESTGPDPAQRFRYRVCSQWEREANEARKFGIRVVNLRTGNVLDPAGGMLGKMVPMLRLAPFIVPFAKNAYLPWISMRDTTGIISFAIDHESISGPLNLVAPTPATTGDLNKALGQVLERKVIGSLPDFLLQVAFGEFSEALLGSQRVLPEKALAAGYVFQDPELGDFIRKALGVRR